MQFQIQEFVKKEKVPVTEKKKLDELDIYVGVHSPLADPFNIFFRARDLTNKLPQIYFYAYSVGTKKIVMWGIYDASLNEFLVDNACVYHPNNLMTMVEKWKSNAYEFSFSSVRDQIRTRMEKFNAFGTESLQGYDGLFKNFKSHFMAKLVRDGIISKDSLQANVASTIEELLKLDEDPFEHNYDEILKRIWETSTVHERRREDYDPFFEILYSEIDNTADEQILRDVIDKEGIEKGVRKASTIWNLQKTNPFHYNLAKYIVANYFVLVYSGFEEYRIAKFIVYLADSKKSKNPIDPEKAQQIRTMIKGSFLYEWLMEIIKALRIPHGQMFIDKYAALLTPFLEERINLTTVGEIGGFHSKEPELNRMAEFFTSFIAMSKYSKASTVGDLKQCPLLEQCDLTVDPTCGLYNHGVTTQSQFDLS
jgi:hypothetical protein